MAFDPAGHLSVITDSGWCYISTDTTTFSNFVPIARAPSVGEVIAMICPVVIPEFPQIVFPIVFVLGMILVSRVRPRKRSPA